MVARWRGVRDAAVITTDGSWSGQDLLAHAAGAADWLDHIGAPDGAPVGALVASTAAAFALIVGAAGSNRPLAPLGPRLTARELAGCVTSMPLEQIVVEEPFIAVAEEVADRTGTKVHVVPEPSTSRRRLDLDPPADAVAFILHTSGTSGAPKAVPYRQDRMGRRAVVHAQLSSFGPGSVFASGAPFHHIAGWGNYASALAAGAAVVPMPSFSVEAWTALAPHRPTNALAVPTMIEMLLEAGALPLEGIRFLHYGGSQIRPETLARVLETLPGVGLVNIFGQTEGSPLTCLTPDDHRRAADEPHLLASVGRAAPGVEVRIEGAGKDGVGEVCARAEHLMRPDADGWLRTGDLARVDAEGYVYLSGRKGDRIVRGGENVYPQEVEHVLLEHPSIRECAVVGVPDVKWGEVIKAFVVADAKRPFDVDGVRSWARSQLAGFKVPTEWAVVDSLPRNQAGKVVRHLLADSAAAK
jgi:acyl-CoA synthetase (AMP-forming)/AMP-acid ligase II